MSSILEVQPFIKLNQDNYEFAAHQANLIESVTVNELLSECYYVRNNVCKIIGKWWLIFKLFVRFTLFYFSVSIKKFFLQSTQ